MHLVQLLLPMKRNDGEPVDPRHFATVRDELVAKFGGMTAYTQSPARGLWEEAEGTVVQDEILI